MLKKVVVFLIILSMVLTASGCGIKRRIEDKVAKKAGEGLLEKLLGNKVDIDDDGIKIKDSEGEIELGSGKWPRDKAGKLLPEYGSGKIVSVINTGKSCVINLEDVKDSSYEKYKKKLNDKGFKDDEVKSEYDNVKSYVVSRKKDKAKVSVLYTVDEKNSIGFNRAGR